LTTELDSLAITEDNPAFYIPGIRPELIYQPQTLEARIAHFNFAKHNYAYFSEKCCGFVAEPFHLDWINFTETYPLVMLMAPRDHSKTTTVNIIRNLWKMVHNKGYQVMMYSETGKLAKMLLSRHDKFMDLPYFNDPVVFDCDLLSNRRKRNDWNTEVKAFGNGSLLTGMGFESATRGPHPHDVVCDDILGDKSKLTGERAKEIFREALSNMPLQRMMVIGTPKHRNDLLHDLLSNTEYFSKKYPAIVDFETKEVLWKDRWSWEKLMRKKNEIGELAFSQEFLCNPIDDSASLFPRDIMEACYDFAQFPGNLERRFNLGELRREGSRYAMGVDLAIGKSDKASFTVATVLEKRKIDHKQHIVIAEIVRLRTDRHEKQLEIIDKLEAKYRPILSYVENNAFQTYLEQLIQDRRITTSVEGYKTGSEKHQVSVGIRSLRQRFENKTFILPRGKDQPDKPAAEQRTIELTNALMNELVDFTEKEGKVVHLGSFTDMAMSLWLALTAMNEIDKKEFSYTFMDMG
jgi:hypothetical protein